MSCARPACARPRLLVLNQYFGSREATGQLLAELVHDLQEDFDITVVAAELAAENTGGAVVPHGVDVRRVASAHFPRTSLGLRALNYLSFLIRLPATALGVSSPSAVLCFTDPPPVGLAALLIARLRGIPFVLVCQDVHPQLGQVSGRLKARPVVFVLRVVQRILLRRATRVVAIGDQMSAVVLELGVRRGCVDTIPNWTDTTLFRPLPRTGRWARAHGLFDRFVVMHAGNVGQLQGLEVLLDAVMDVPGVTLAVVGDGSGRDALAKLAEGRSDVVILPWQDRDRMSEVLAAADALVVSLMPGLAGLLEPSKLYGMLAAGRPVLAVLDSESEGARVVTQERCGVVAQAGDRYAIAAALRALLEASADERDAMGQRARAYAEEHADRRHAAAKYALTLKRAIAAGQAPARAAAARRRAV
jgi:glycosyltransferase involved in cell wall biosynthesis